MPEVREWRQDPTQEGIAQLVQRLCAGQVVAFPTDTRYVAAACAACGDAVPRLQQAAGDARPALAVRTARGGIEAAGLAPGARRLLRRCWPGPAAFRVPAALCEALLADLPAAARSALAPGGEVTLESPCHEALWNVLHGMPSPVAVAPLAGPGGAPAATPEAALAAAGGADLVVLDGPTHFGRPPSVVRLGAGGWELLAEGVITREELQLLAGCRIVFVCTGNTCRSPLAEALCKNLLAERLGCAPESLPEHGFSVASAGLSAAPGWAASPEAVEVARELGADLAGHSSRPLTLEMIEQADHVLTMTQGHLQMLQSLGRTFECEPRLLSCGGEDVTDPIGSEREVYRACADQIVRHLRQRLPEFQP